MIDTENLTRKFGDLTAVENVTLHVDEGKFSVFRLKWSRKNHHDTNAVLPIGKTSGQAQSRRLLS